MDFEIKLKHLIDEALREDIGEGDHTTLSCIPAEAKGKAVLKIKQIGKYKILQVQTGWRRNEIWRKSF